MKKILIVSDTHRRDKNLERVLAEESPIDMMIHLGDAEGSEERYRRWLPGKTELIVVRGNNDYFSALESEREVRIGRYRCLLVHGHYYDVSLDLSLLRKEAIARGFDIAMFGHTHRPVVEIGKEVTLLNPGSLSFPRQEGHRPSYLIMTLDESGNAHYELRFL